MGESPTIDVAWRQRVPAHPLRYAACLALVGIAHGVIVGMGARWLKPADHVSLFLPPLIPTLFVVPSAWLVGWLLRGRIAAVRGSGLPLLALLTTLLGAWVACSSLVALASLERLFTAEWTFSVLMIVFCWFFGGFLVVWGGWLFFPVGFAATWIAILALRLAAGGTIERPARRRFLRPRLAT